MLWTYDTRVTQPVMMVSVILFFLLGACNSREKNLSNHSFSRLVAEVDLLKIPIEKKDLGEDYEGAVEGESGFLGLRPDILAVPEFKDGLRASLLGSPERPVAMIFWVQSKGENYYVPFPGVGEVDRPRRMSKVGERIYRIESNRSSKGVRVEKTLP